MKYLSTLLVMLLTTQLLSAQAPTYVSSPYRYSYSTISHSSKMVDSINRRFVRQPAGKSFHSLPQAVAHYMVLEGNDLEKVKQDMERGIHFDRIMIENHEAITELKQHCLVTLSYLLRGKDSVTLLNTPTWRCQPKMGSGSGPTRIAFAKAGPIPGSSSTLRDTVRPHRSSRPISS